VSSPGSSFRLSGRPTWLEALEEGIAARER
jgi:hypothetical protein